MAWPAIIAAGAQLASTAYGADQASKQQKDAEALRQQALQQFADLNGYLPTWDESALNFEQLQSAGQMTPEIEALVNMGPSAMEGISLDPGLRAKQMEALQQYSQIAETGMSPADMAAMELVRRNVAGESQAKQGQILQNMQQRGIGGSGAELLAKLTSQQSDADRQAQMALEQAQMQAQARRDALAQQASLSSGIRSQDYGQQSDLARAKDVINQFNTQNAQGINTRNTDRRTQAAATNLANKQDLMSRNTALRNQQQQYNKELYQRDFDNRAKLAAGATGQLGGMADAKQKQAGDTAGMYAGVGQGIGSIITSMYGNKKE